MLIIDKALNSVQASGTIEINNNTLQATHPSITAVGTEALANGIVFNGGLITNVSNNTMLNCHNNKLYNTSFGIKINGLIGKDFNISNNIISVANSTNASDSKFGIALFGGSPNTTGLVENNTITGSCITCNQSGIYLLKQLNTTIGCNIVGGANPSGLVGGLTNGFRFSDINTGTQFWDNMMYKSNRYGFTLENGGAIGQQGTERTPGNLDGCTSNNSWGAPVSAWNGLVHKMTNNIVSDPTQSPLIVVNNIWTNPDLCGGAPTFGTSPYQVSDNSIMIRDNDLGCPINRCNATVQLLGRRRNNFTLGLQIADGSIAIPMVDAEQRLYVLQEQLYENLQRDETLVAEYPELQTFMEDRSWGSYDFIYYTPRYLAEGDVNSVDLLLAYFPSDNVVDDNYWQYYHWINEMLQNPSYQPPIDDVFALANLCPARHGLVVFAAQNLYMQLTGSVYNFESSCESQPAPRQTKPQAKRIVSTDKLEGDIQIYPNPSNGVVNIKLPFFNSSNYKVSISDIYGKTIVEQQVKNSTNAVQFNITNGKGVYFVTITNAKTGIQKISKIVVN